MWAIFSVVLIQNMSEPFNVKPKVQSEPFNAKPKVQSPCSYKEDINFAVLRSKV